MGGKFHLNTLTCHRYLYNFGSFINEEGFSYTESCPSCGLAKKYMKCMDDYYLIFIPALKMFTCYPLADTHEYTSLCSEKDPNDDLCIKCPSDRTGVIYEFIDTFAMVCAIPNLIMKGWFGKYYLFTLPLSAFGPRVPL